MDFEFKKLKYCPVRELLHERCVTFTEQLHNLTTQLISLTSAYAEEFAAFESKCTESRASLSQARSKIPEPAAES